MTILTLSAVALAGADPKIINGEDAAASDYAMTGATLVEIGYQGEFSKAVVCTSTLIAPDTVLLAAHCIDEDTLTYGFFDLGDMVWSQQADLSGWADGSASGWPDDAIDVADMVAHPDFFLSNDLGVTQFNDIALIFLAEAVTDVDFAYVIQPDEEDQVVVDAPLEIVGWGQQIATDFFETPPAGSIGIKQMGESFIAELGSHEFQVGLAEDDTRKCHGDSGGPSFMRVTTEKDDDMRVVGVTSHAYDESDCWETGGVDTRVGPYVDWIDAEMQARCDDGTRVWCEESGLPVPPEPELEEEELDGEDKSGRLSCTSTGGSAGLGLALLALLGLARRRG